MLGEYGTPIEGEFAQDVVLSVTCAGEQAPEEPRETKPATGLTCENILDKKQCKRSLTCEYNKKRGCATAPAAACSELSNKDCRKRKNKRWCKIKKSRKKVDGKNVKTKSCVNK